MGVLDGLKTAADVLRAADKISEYQQILEAMAKMMELQGQVEAEKQRVKELQAELAAIREDQVKADGIVREGDFYNLNGNAYCVFCWEVEKRLGPLVPRHKVVGGRNERFYQCTRCKQELTPRSRL
jgi:L-fucose mutarotase/ribose pyranase (RbsD/FucU family)